MAATGLVGLLVGVVFGLTIGSLVGALILRAAISVANKILGPQTNPQSAPQAIQPVAEEAGSVGTSEALDPSNPYSAPVTTSPLAASAAALAIPEPTFGRALVISALVGVLGFAISFALGIVGQASPAMDVLARLGSFVLNFFVTTFVFKKMLPTTFARSVLIYLMYILIVLLVVVVIGGIGFVLFRLA